MRFAQVLAGLILVSAPAAKAAEVSSVDTSILNNKGESIGTAKLSGGTTATVIRITLNAGALSPGWHGIHLHAHGDCSDHDKFMASKGHVNVGSKKHGLLNADGPDDGDLPNIFANSDGSVNAELSTTTKLVTLRDTDGSALVIHANADDHVTQPIGGAGARVACGVVK